jgi:hypothetical protein
MKKPFAIICPAIQDSTSLYRGAGPFHELEEAMPGLRIHPNPPSVDWQVCAAHSGFFLQRPFNQEQINIVNLAHQNGKKVWIDYDDNYFGLLADNPAFDIYKQPQNQANIIKLCELADVISVSTEYLKTILESKLNIKKDIRVIRNGYDHVRANKQFHEQHQNIILWRGSHTHIRDLYFYAPEMIRLANELPHWKWVFVGWNPWMLHEHFPKGQLVYQEPIDPCQFYICLDQIKPQITFVPLFDSPFNRSKSNIGAIEGSFSGSAVFAPDWDEWKIPGITNYKDKASFYLNLKRLMELSSDKRKELNHQIWGYIEQNLTLTKMNEGRAQILKDYFGY